MIQSETAVGRFFALYARDNNDGDITKTVSHFADPFLSAGPQGTQCVRVAEFAAALPRRKQLFDKLQCQPTELVDLHETALDDRYVLAWTQWRMMFAHESGPVELLVDSSFLVDTGGQEPKIAMYMAHQDIMQVMRERGILKEEERR
jgi:hypothetical protein